MSIDDEHDRHWKANTVYYGNIKIKYSIGWRHLLNTYVTCCILFNQPWWFCNQQNFEQYMNLSQSSKFFAYMSRIKHRMDCMKFGFYSNVLLNVGMHTFKKQFEGQKPQRMLHHYTFN